MKKKGLWIALALVVAAIGGYLVLYYYFSNHVVIDDRPLTAGQRTDKPLELADLKQRFDVAEGSSAYFTVTTSIDKINGQFKQMSGFWQIDYAVPGQMTGEAKVGIASLTTGIRDRDSHLISEEYLSAEAHPDAVFQFNTFEQWPATLTPQQPWKFKLNGTLTIRGVSKDVQFDCEAVVDGQVLKLNGTAMVTFGDFRMKNPHRVVIRTQDDITITVQAMFKPAGDKATMRP